MKGLINYWLPVMIWMGGIYWRSSLSMLPEPLSSPSWEGLLLRKGVHPMEYAVLATLLWRVLLDAYPAQAEAEYGESNSPPPAAPTLSSRHWTFPLAFVIALLYAIFHEWYQSLIPNCQAWLLDVGIDMLGMVAALGLIWWRSALK